MVLQNDANCKMKVSFPSIDKINQTKYKVYCSPDFLAGISREFSISSVGVASECRKKNKRNS